MDFGCTVGVAATVTLARPTGYRSRGNHSRCQSADAISLARTRIDLVVLFLPRVLAPDNYDLGKL